MKKSDPPFSGSTFNIMDASAANLMAKSLELLESKANRKKNKPSYFKTMSEVRRDMLPIRDFMLQWLIGSYGFNHRSIVEIIGAEGLGKTTLGCFFLSCCVRAGGPTLYIECENKPLTPKRMMRVLSTDPVEAERIVKQAVTFVSARSLAQMEEQMNAWIDTWRNDMGIPLSIPLGILVDPWGKLMNKHEAAGFHDWGKALDADGKKKFKDTGEASNLAHSNWAHAWTRRLAETIDRNNVILFVVHHQNAKIDMAAGGGGMMLSEAVGNLYNKTHIGGRATDQSASLQLIMARKGIWKDSQRSNLGKLVNIRCDKNSYGPDGRLIEVGIRNEHEGFDHAGYLDPAIHCEESFSKWMADNAFLGTTASQARYSSEVLGCVRSTAEEFSQIFHANSAAMRELGRVTRIEGYDDIVDRLREEHTTEETPAAAPDEEVVVQYIDVFDKE